MHIIQFDVQHMKQGTRRRGQQKKSWFHNVKELTTHKGAHLLHLAESRDKWHVLVKEASSVSPQQASTTLTGWVSECDMKHRSSLSEVTCHQSRTSHTGLFQKECLLKWLHCKSVGYSSECSYVLLFHTTLINN